MKIKILLPIIILLLIVSILSIFSCPFQDEEAEKRYITFDKDECLSNLVKWKALDIKDYQFTYSHNSQYGHDTTTDVLVENNKLKSYSYKDEYGNDVVVKIVSDDYYSSRDAANIDTLFYNIVYFYDKENGYEYRSYNSYCTSIDVEYDDYYGFPKFVKYNYHTSDLVSSDRSRDIYRISNFQTF